VFSWSVDRSEILQWLEEAEGGDFSLGATVVFFYEEKDATMFILRWA
jgi:hypothetical protein